MAFRRRPVRAWRLVWRPGCDGCRSLSNGVTIGVDAESATRSAIARTGAMPLNGQERASELKSAVACRTRSAATIALRATDREVSVAQRRRRRVLLLTGGALSSDRVRAIGALARFPNCISTRLRPTVRSLIGGFVAFDEVVRELKQTEQQLQTQLEGIRAAISALETGLTARAIRRSPGRHPQPTIVKSARKRGSWSAAARKAVSLRMKKYWAAKRRKAKAA
jgi:hypothetical protein